MEHHASVQDIIFDSNVINFAVVAVLLAWFLIKFLPQSAKETREKLEVELNEARAAREAAEKKLKEIDAKLSRSTQESQTIVSEANQTAEKIKERVLEEAQEKINRMKDIAEKDIQSKKAAAMASIKEIAAEASINLTEEAVKNATQNEDTLRNIQDKFVKELSQTK